MKRLTDNEIAEMEKRLSPKEADTLSFADEFELTLTLAYNKSLKRLEELVDD